MENHESIAGKKQRVKKMITALRKEYPDCRVELNFSNPLELLVAVMLSAQCTDVRVNIVTAELFKKYKTAKDYAAANPAILEQDIRSTGFYKNKAKNIIACCKALVDHHNSRVPNSMEQLIELAGVGRKTANCVLGGAFGINSGVVVDTHVNRLSQRIGLSQHDDPEKIEQDLMALIPEKEWYDFGNLLIWHGRRVCGARKPLCSQCAVIKLCPSAKVFLE
ncbi:MAG: endonuclease III [bacterium]